MKVLMLISFILFGCGTIQVDTINDMRCQFDGDCFANELCVGPDYIDYDEFGKPLPVARTCMRQTRPMYSLKRGEITSYCTMWNSAGDPPKYMRRKNSWCPSGFEVAEFCYYLNWRMVCE